MVRLVKTALNTVENALERNNVIMSTDPVQGDVTLATMESGAEKVVRVNCI